MACYRHVRFAGCSHRTATVWELWKNNWGGWQIWGEALQAPKGVEFGEGWGCGEGCAPSTEKFVTFCHKIVHFGVYSDKDSQFSTLSHTFIYICHCWGGVMPDPPGVLQGTLTGGGSIPQSPRQFSPCTATVSSQSACWLTATGSHLVVGHVDFLHLLHYTVILEYSDVRYGTRSSTRVVNYSIPSSPNYYLHMASYNLRDQWIIMFLFAATTTPTTTTTTTATTTTPSTTTREIILASFASLYSARLIWSFADEIRSHDASRGVRCYHFHRISANIRRIFAAICGYLKQIFERDYPQR